MRCRHCAAELEHLFLDLGHAPPSNAYLSREQLDSPETTFPLRLYVCERCWLVQTRDYAPAKELFTSDYAYFSSTSSTWLAHAARYFETVRARFALGKDSQVVEVASNDGYLLRHFVQAGIPCLGIEPTASTAAVAEAFGIPVRREFFGEHLGIELAAQGLAADLLIGNNVCAHVPDINDFVAGLGVALKTGGVVTLHFSYLSLYTLDKIFQSAGLRIFDVEELETHGGSLRVFGCRNDDSRATRRTVSEVLEAEARMGLRTLERYREFQACADRIKDDLLGFLIEQKRAGRSVGAYGAAAKGNTLLNYAGIKPDLLPYVCDAAAAKQGKLLPASHIPILAPAELMVRKPDFVLILPWNISAEVMTSLAEVKNWGGRFVTAVPRLQFH
jgi:SAM-dependent methyltransferase